MWPNIIIDILVWHFASNSCYKWYLLARHEDMFLFSGFCVSFPHHLKVLAGNAFCFVLYRPLSDEIYCAFALLCAFMFRLTSNSWLISLYMRQSGYNSQNFYEIFNSLQCRMSLWQFNELILKYLINANSVSNDVIQ